MLTLEYGIFEQNGFSSLYLDNYGDSITGIMIYFALFLLFGIASLYKTKEELVTCRTGKIYAGIFGLFVSTISGGIQSQTLYFAIQFLKVDLFVDLYSRISYFTAYLLFSVAIGVQLICFFKVITIFNKKIEVIETERLRKSRIRKSRFAIPVNNFLEIAIPLSTDDVWNEKKYSMFFNSFKESSKHSFLFTYWITLYNIIYILLILSLQNLPVLQCLSILVLVIICILVSATIKPFKERSVAFLFFFNFACVLVLAIINLTLAILATVDGDTSANDRVGWIIFSIILINSGMNIIVGFGGVLYKLFLLCKTRINNKKVNSSTSTVQQVAIIRPNHPINEPEEHNRRSNLQHNNQSNQPASRNDGDSSVKVRRDQSEVQERDHQDLSRIKSTRREEGIVLNSESRGINFNSQRDQKDHRKIHLNQDSKKSSPRKY